MKVELMSKLLIAVASVKPSAVVDNVIIVLQRMQWGGSMAMMVVAAVDGVVVVVVFKLLFDVDSSGGSTWNQGEIGVLTFLTLRTATTAPSTSAQASTTASEQGPP